LAKGATEFKSKKEKKRPELELESNLDPSLSLAPLLPRPSYSWLNNSIEGAIEFKSLKKKPELKLKFDLACACALRNYTIVACDNF
jgi:hypothetical protein